MMYTNPRVCADCRMLVHPQDLPDHRQACRGRPPREVPQPQLQPGFIVDQAFLAHNHHQAALRNQELFREVQRGDFGNPNYLDFFRRNPANQGLEQNRRQRLRLQPPVEQASPGQGQTSNSRSLSSVPQNGRSPAQSQSQPLQTAENRPPASLEQVEEFECYKCGAVGGRSHQCDYQLCSHCSSYYPGVLFEEHVAVCEMNPRRRRVRVAAAPEDHPWLHEAGHPLEDAFFFRRPGETTSGHMLRARYMARRSISPGPPQRVSQRLAAHQLEQASNRPQVGSDRRNPESLTFGSPPGRLGETDSRRSDSLDDEFGSLTSSLLNGSPEDEVYINFRRVISLSQAGRANQRLLFERLASILLEGPGRRQPPAQRVSSQQLGALPVIQFKKKSQVQAGEEEKCPVCCAEFEDREDCKLLPCTHMFHPPCIDTWLTRSVLCPICKRDVTRPG